MKYCIRFLRFPYLPPESPEVVATTEGKEDDAQAWLSCLLYFQGTSINDVRTILGISDPPPHSYAFSVVFVCKTGPFSFPLPPPIGADVINGRPLPGSDREWRRWRTKQKSFPKVSGDGRTTRAPKGD